MMPRNYFYSYTEASRAEEKIPSMTYRTLVENLVPLTEMGVLETGSPAAMLVAARLVDRSRIERSGMTAVDMRKALAQYRAHPLAVYGIVKALEQALSALCRNPGAPDRPVPVV